MHRIASRFACPSSAAIARRATLVAVVSLLASSLAGCGTDPAIRDPDKSRPDLLIVFPGCPNGIKDLDESDVDCGGSCMTKCTSGRACKKGEDCESTLCIASVCAPPNQCSNLTRDGDETDVDCGGSCPRCGFGRGCAKPGDCLSGKCEGNFCAALTPALTGGKRVALGMNPAAVTAADFDQDGKIDLAAADGIEDKLWVALGKGDGTFNAATSVVCPAVGGPDAIASGDLNDDKRPDIIVTTGGKVNVFINQGPPMMGMPLFKAVPAGGFTSGSDPGYPRIASMDADGKVDVVTTDTSYDFDAGAYSLWISPNPGMSMWRATKKVVAGDDAPVSPIIADFNDDGKNDVVAILAGDIGFAAGMGDGTFKPFVRSTTGMLTATRIAAGDMDGDLRLDIVLVDRGADSAGVMLSTDPGKWGRPIKVIAPNGPTALVVADFDLDGVLDFVTSNYDNDTATLYVGLGQGLLMSKLSTGAGTSPLALVAADFNGDGRTDLVAPNPDANQVTIILNSGK